MRLFCCVAISLVALPLPAHAQGRPLRDAAILAEFAKSDPCPRTIPGAWLQLDSAMAKSPLCSLLAVTARHLSTSENPRFRSAAAHPVCVLIAPFDFADSDGKSDGFAYWSVEFYVDSLGGGRGVVDRRTGEIWIVPSNNEFGAPLEELCGPRGRWSGKEASPKFVGVVHSVEELVPSGIVDMVGSASGDLYFRTLFPFGLWHIDSAGAANRLTGADSIASALGGQLSGPFLQRDGSLVLWHDATGTRITVGPDDRLLDVRALSGVAKLPGRPFAISSDGVVHTQRDSVAGRTIVLSGSDGPHVDTLWLPEARYRVLRSCITDGPVTVCQRSPFQPEMQWVAGSGSLFVWSDGADSCIRTISGREQLNPFACIGAGARAPVSEDERSNEAEIIAWANRHNDPTWVGPTPTIPATKAAVERLSFDQADRLWVVHPTASVAVPPAEQRPYFPDQPSPAKRWRRMWELLVYSKFGEPLAKIALPAGFEPSQWAAGGGILWALRVDASGTRMELAKFTIPTLPSEHAPDVGFKLGLRW